MVFNGAWRVGFEAESKPRQARISLCLLLKHSRVVFVPAFRFVSYCGPVGGRLGTAECAAPANNFRALVQGSRRTPSGLLALLLVDVAAVSPDRGAVVEGGSWASRMWGRLKREAVGQEMSHGGYDDASAVSVQNTGRARKAPLFALHHAKATQKILKRKLQIASIYDEILYSPNDFVNPCDSGRLMMVDRLREDDCSLEKAVGFDSRCACRRRPPTVRGRIRGYFIKRWLVAVNDTFAPVIRLRKRLLVSA